MVNMLLLSSECILAEILHRSVQFRERRVQATENRAGGGEDLGHRAELRA